ncbi:uncharacterized protein [Leptinotarsa decemlineata]|uniref:uncharacterized protein n=1 Tax=Leptinotarsa decemlineata TaxID=7539 RepID=UPI000C251E48|nr:uncharacterized protein LOC111511723 [Leptinotarsa decemlineata]
MLHKTEIRMEELKENLKGELKESVMKIDDEVKREVHTVQEEMIGLEKRVEKQIALLKNQDRRDRVATSTISVKPPTFDGQSSRSMYRRQFEAAAQTTYSRWFVGCGNDEWMG